LQADENCYGRWCNRHAAKTVLLFIGVRLFPFFIPVIPLIQRVHAYRTDTVGKGQMGVGLKITVHIIPKALIIPDFFAV
jgi:hypothetical protein